jgi:putative flippase GtrA
MGQLVRFGIVGGLNTFVDYGMFNLLVGVFGVSYLMANPIAITAGILNSFLWNKNWTFSANRSRAWAREAVLFVLVSVIGMLLNTGGLWLLTWLSGNEALWAMNLQKLGASVVSMTWNFLGYRFLVFRRHFEEKEG